MRIRPYSSQDLDHLHAINEAGVPGVASETRQALGTWIALSMALIAADHESDVPVGFLTLIELGTAAYDSANLRWFEARQAREGGDTVYVDRIAVHPDWRGQGVGASLYRFAFDLLGDRDEIGCEINIRPPNPASRRFHSGLGFRQIGERSHANGEKAVGYWVRPLGRRP